MNYNQTIEIINDIATRHLMINAFGHGDDWEIGASTAELHPLLWLTPIAAYMTKSSTGSYATFELEFNLKVMDLVDKGEANEQDVQSDTLKILRDVANEITQNPYYSNSSFELVDDLTFEPFTEAFDSEVSGWEVTMRFRTPNTDTFCGLPIEAIDGFSFSTECADCNSSTPVSYVCSIEAGDNVEVNMNGCIATISSTDIYTTGSTLVSGTTLVFDTNAELSAYTVDMSNLTITGATGDTRTIPLIYNDDVITRNVITAKGSNSIDNYSGFKSILSGIFNNIDGPTTYSTIQSGAFNQIKRSTRSNIVGGRAGRLFDSDFSSIFSGEYNHIYNNSHYSLILGGNYNTVSASTRSMIGSGLQNDIISSSNSTIIGGSNGNITSSNYSLIGAGKDNTLNNADYSIIGGGRGHNITVNESFIGGGINNSITGGTYSAIAGGYGNKVGGNGSFIGAGYGNQTGGFGSIVGGGNGNVVIAQSSAIISGEFNNNSVGKSFIGTGVRNTISGNGTQSVAIVAGDDNTVIDSTNSFIGSGKENTLSGSEYSNIVGGQNNTITTTTGKGNSIVGGNNNELTNINDGNVIVGGGYGANGNKITGLLGKQSFMNFIGGGNTNYIDASVSNINYSSIVGGNGNIIEGSSSQSNIGGGYGNKINTTLRTNIGGGYGNYITRIESSVIAGGEDNTINGSFFGKVHKWSTIGGGGGNKIGTTQGGFIGGGISNQINYGPLGVPLVESGFGSSIVGGAYNNIRADYSFIGNGSGNTINGDYSSIIGGKGNTVSSDYSVVLNGHSGNIVDSAYSVLSVSFPYASGWSTISGSPYSTVTGNNKAIGKISFGGNHLLGGWYNEVNTSDYCHTIGGAYNNINDSIYCNVIGGSYNIGVNAGNFVYSGDGCTIIGSANNMTGLTNTHIIGSEIIATSDNTTYVNSFHVDGRASFDMNSSVVTTTATTLDLSVGNIFTIDLSGSTELDYTNAAVGTYQLIIAEQTTGSTLTFAADQFLSSGGASPVLTATSGATDMLSMVYTGTDMIIIELNDLSPIV